jgi:uncharacterized membrane protein
VFILSLLPYKANIIDGVHFRFVAAPQQCPTYIKLSLIFFVDYIHFVFWAFAARNQATTSRLRAKDPAKAKILMDALIS